jgi:pimeloyl-ACP methyl ester carboxylesterase
VSVDSAEILVEGPWHHRLVAAHGARFHVAEAGTGPLVVLLHGFPQFWWAWRAQLPALAAAGYRVAAMDLRGYGASDKPPRGYDTATLAADVAGVIRALGESQAVIIGHDWGAWVAWAMPSLQPRVTRGIGVLSMGHPLTMRTELARGRQRHTLARLLGYQTPWLPERRLTRGDGVADALTAWWGEGRPDPAAVIRYQRAMQVPFVAQKSMEYFRTALRSTGRREARRLTSALECPIAVPVLQLHGALDPWVLPETAALSRHWVQGPLHARMLPRAGHYLPEECAQPVTDALLDWLAVTLRTAPRAVST